MALPTHIRERLSLPVFCAPMFKVTGPALVREACKAGFMAGLPRANAPDAGTFDRWLSDIGADLSAHQQAHPGARIGPIAVNLSTRLEPDQMEAELDICQRHGVEIIVSAAGDPTRLIPHVHARGMSVFHDVTTMRFAQKTIEARADGLICIGAGGGGHSGLISQLALVPRIRAIFDGVIVMAGAISNGAAVRAAEILGADLAYMGTRFIATQEADVAPAYKQMLVDESSAALMYTRSISGVPANWLVASLQANGLDPAQLPEPLGRGPGIGHLPEGVRPWHTVWSAGHGIDLITDIPSVAELASRLRREYIAACATPDMAQAAKLAQEAAKSAINQSAA